MIDVEPLRSLIDGLSGRPIETADWPAVIVAANRALVTGILAARLEGGPEDVRSFLSVVHQRSLERNARLKAQLDEAVSQLNRAGLQPMLLKGAAILHSAGPDYAARIQADLDIMVPASSMAAAERSLEAIGYRPFAHDEGRSDGPRTLCRTRDVGMVDLHCRTKVRYPGFDFADLLPYCTEIRLGSATAWLPSPTIQALIFILHDQLQERDYWRGLIDLRHLLDLRELARSPAGFDWARLASLVPDGYPRNALDVQLRTLEALFGLDAEVPPRSLRWADFQLRRRLAQLRRPALARPLTLLTLLLDPPWQAGLAGARATPIEHGRFRHTRLPRRLQHALSAGRRFMSKGNLGKI